MTHASDEQLLAFEDGELTAGDHSRVAAHVAACASCASRLDDWRQGNRRTSALLGSLDHRASAVPVDVVIARASRAPAGNRRALIAASIALIVVAGGAAALVPGGALRHYIERVIAESPFAAPRGVPQTPVAAAVSAHQSAASGIAFVPARVVEVAFRNGQMAGKIRITLSDSNVVRIRQDDGHGGFALTGAGVVVENAGSRASYAIMLPRAAHRAVVRVRNQIVFATANGDIATAAARDSSGSYVVAFTRLGDKEP